jgi:hypothetical protein
MVAGCDEFAHFASASPVPLAPAEIEDVPLSSPSTFIACKQRKDNEVALKTGEEWASADELRQEAERFQDRATKSRTVLVASTLRGSRVWSEVIARRHLQDPCEMSLQCSDGRADALPEVNVSRNCETITTRSFWKDKGRKLSV